MDYSIHHISLVVSDTRRALAFYCGVLGMQTAERPELGFAGAWLQVAGQQIHLLQVPNVDPLNGRPDHVGRDRHSAFRVGRLADIEQCLRDAKVAFTRSRSGRKALFCRDPDGNGLEFIEI
ncbi:MAG: VOC family protein [gamma proteobacterium symbiont of Bathyaustriella thionipta]|nr:VOC family protein [gamma proteobacterium symbiont of Bathyaustriella thionipta]